MYCWVTGGRVCEERWPPGGRRVASSCPSVGWGRLCHCVYLYSRLQEAEPCECDEHSGLVAVWPLCVHTCSFTGASSLRAPGGRTGGTLLCLMEVLIPYRLHFPRTLSEPRQAEIRKQCLRLWGVSISTPA